MCDVRVILTEEQKFNDSFLGFIKKTLKFIVAENTTVYPKQTKVTGVNYSADICDEVYQVLYSINEYDDIEVYELEELKMYKNGIISI